MAVVLEVPVGVGREPVVAVAVQDDRVVVRDAAAAEQLAELGGAEEVALHLVLEVLLPVEADRAGDVRLGVEGGVLVDLDDPNGFVGEVVLDPLRVDQDILGVFGHGAEGSQAEAARREYAHARSWSTLRCDPFPPGRPARSIRPRRCARWARGSRRWTRRPPARSRSWCWRSGRAPRWPWRWACPGTSSARLLAAARKELRQTRGHARRQRLVRASRGPDLRPPRRRARRHRRAPPRRPPAQLQPAAWSTSAAWCRQPTRW